MADEIEDTDQIEETPAVEEAPSVGDILSALMNDPEGEGYSEPQTPVQRSKDEEVTKDGAEASDAAEAKPEAKDESLEEEGDPKDDTSANADAVSGTAAEGASETTAVVEGEQEQAQTADDPAPSPRQDFEQRYAAADAQLREREAKLEKDLADYDASIAAKVAKGEGEDPIDDHPRALKLLREQNNLARARNDLLLARQRHLEQEAETERYWEKEFPKPFEGRISGTEARKVFEEEIKKAYAKYKNTNYSQETIVAMAHAAATEAFDFRIKTLDGQRKAKAARTRAATSSAVKPPVPKTPITKGGGRVIPPPQAGGVGGRVVQPKPKTTEEGLNDLAVKAKSSPVDILLS